MTNTPKSILTLIKNRSVHDNGIVRMLEHDYNFLIETVIIALDEAEKEENNSNQLTINFEKTAEGREDGNKVG